MNSTSADNELRAVKRLLGIIVVFFSLYALNAAAVVFLPAVISLLIVMLVAPAQYWIDEKLKQKYRWLSISLAMVLLVTVLGTFTAVVAFIVNIMLEQTSRYGESLSEMIQRFTGEEVGISEVLRNTAGFLGSLFGTIWTTLGTLVLIIFLVLLFLIEISDWKSKVHSSFSNTQRGRIIDTINVSAQKVRRFMLVMAFVSAISGLAVALLLLITGVRYAVIWGFIAFVLNFVPYLGSVVVVIMLSIIALIELSTTGALIAISGLILINAVVGNYLAPRLEGNALLLSPWVVLVSLMFWGWMWGAIGALIAIPLTVSIVVACENVPSLEPIARLLKKTE